LASALAAPNAASSSSSVSATKTRPEPSTRNFGIFPVENVVAVRRESGVPCHAGVIQDDDGIELIADGSVFPFRFERPVSR
jgi:hypothetical protein